MEIRIKGLPAVLVILAIGAFMVWRTTSAYADLEDGAAEQLALWIRAEYAGKQLRTVKGVEDLTPAKVDSILASHDITFPSIKARGAVGDLIVRAEVQVAGQPPPDGDAVRYYRMKYSTITGWHMQHRTTAFAYYTAIF